ncbi:MAG TPA: protease modulator HflK [Candidatus Paceibacterota bacterium]|nr:protease modulator HflK [Verrucomicrobiota bacterium]HOX02244.1 protease modulator HflK [Verrucomicrobiota bacterium]HRZ46074.1 protease modulator HflK [Candidatus Paceibacterota bacterium]
MIDPSLPPSPNPPAPPEPPAAAAQPRASAEDASSQALSEALRSSFAIVKFLMAGLVILFVGSRVFTVHPDETAVILRFGRPVGVGSQQYLAPGLHWGLPYPIDEIVRIPVGQSLTIVSTAGWYPTRPEWEATGQLPPAYPYLQPGIDGYTLAADGNIIHARATLKYRILPEQAGQYVFGFASPTNLLQNLLDNSLIYASTRYRADEAIYRDKLAFTERVRERLLELLDHHRLGISVDALDVETSAPLDVRPAFDEVLNAQQVARTRLSEAESYARSATNTAIAQANAIHIDSLTRSNEIVKTMAAEARSFQDQLPHHQANPQLFRQRLLLETMGRVLTNAQEKYFLPQRADGQPRELRLQLNREPQKPVPTR